MISFVSTKPPWELVELDFVWQFRNKDTTSYTEVDGEIVTIPQLCQVLLEQGLIDPLVLRVYTNGHRGTIRLEEGNHRIQVLRVFNTQAPVIVELAETSVGHLGNGAHLYSIDMTLLRDHVKDLAPGRYLPSEIFV